MATYVVLLNDGIIQSENFMGIEILDICQLPVILNSLAGADSGNCARRNKQQISRIKQGSRNKIRIEMEELQKGYSFSGSS